MKILRYELGGQAEFGVLHEDGSILELAGSPFDGPRAGGRVAGIEDVRVLAPVEPSKIICVGLNYVSHIEESGAATPEFPMLFMKPHTAVIAQGEPIVYPAHGKVVHHEAELTAVIGRQARRVSEEAALDYVLGYTCGNDVSERVIQAAEMKMGAMLIGKSIDTFCPLGPVIATGLDPTDIEVKARVNGETKQDSNTSDLLFSVAHLVSYISQSITLLPGDVILTGTPEGVGPIAAGDTVEIELSGVGVLSNPVVAEC